jgi:hypothetical protein
MESDITSSNKTSYSLLKSRYINGIISKENNISSLPKIYIYVCVYIYILFIYCFFTIYSRYLNRVISKRDVCEYLK